MSRSGYSDDCDGWALIRWRGAVNSALRGRRGQAFLREAAAALDAMPEKRLIADELQSAQGEVCMLGAVGRARGLPMEGLDPEDRRGVSIAFGIAPAMAAEVVFENDEAGWWTETPEQRWARVRAWVADQIRPAA